MVALSGRGLQGVAGLGLTAFGCWEAWHPLGWIVAGLVLLADRWDNARGGGS